jgi:hypothetical protein
MKKKHAYSIKNLTSHKIQNYINPVFTSSTIMEGGGVGEPCHEWDRNLGRLLFSARSLAMATSSLFLKITMNFNITPLDSRHSSL